MFRGSSLFIEVGRGLSDGNYHWGESEAISISMLVRLVHQVFHLDLLPAGLVSTMTHASRVLLAEGSWDMPFTAAPRGTNLISQARREREEGQDQDEECGQSDHQQQEYVHVVRRERFLILREDLCSNDGCPSRW